MLDWWFNAAKEVLQNSLKNISLTNLTSSVFDPRDPEQCRYIEEQVSLFEENVKKLKFTDKVLGAGLSADVLFLFTGGFISKLLGTAGLGALYLYGTQYANRQEKYHLFQKQLDEMLSLYRWCEKGNGAKITHNPTFLKILAAIVAYVPTDKLILWNLQNTKSTDISEAFMLTLSKPPHNVQFIKIGSDSQPTLPVQKNKWYGLFEEAVAKTQWIVYGHEIKEQGRTPRI